MRKKIKIFYLLTIKEFRNFKFEKKYLVFLFFLFLSTVFWFLNALDKEYTSFIKVPIEFVNVAENKILTSSQNFSENLTVKINSRGFKIFKYNAKFSKSEIKIKSNSKFITNLKNDSLRLFLKTSNLKNLISAHLGEDFRILNIQPDSLVFSYENTISKKVAVKTNIQIDFRPQFFKSAKTELIPDSVVITGTKAILDTINEVETQLYEFNALDTDLNLTCDLKLIDGIKYHVNFVNIHIPVEEYTEKTMSIPLEIINLPAGYELQLFPKKIHVQFNISISNYLKVKSNDFNFIVDYNDIDENAKNLKVKFENKSLFLFDLKISPKKVEYILEK